MKLTEQLMGEHEIIKKVLDSLQEKILESRRAMTVDTTFLKKLLQFSKEFIDSCHHAKEERCLFTCLERRGISREGGPIGVMLYEHDLGRSLVRKIHDALARYERSEVAVDEVLDRCEEYLELLRQHIYKEDNILFPMGDGVMGEIDQEEVLRCAEKVESPRHERLHKLAESLASRK